MSGREDNRSQRLRQTDNNESGSEGSSYHSWPAKTAENVPDNDSVNEIGDLSPTGSRRSQSNRSARSTSSTKARRVAEAELKAAEELAKLDLEELEKRSEIKKKLIDQRLKAEKAEIEEELDDSDGSLHSIDLKSLRQSPRDKVSRWVNRDRDSDSIDNRDILSKALEIIQQQANTISKDQAGKSTLNYSSAESSRRTIGRELSSFSGNPEEWPSFISEFKECTKLCAFSDRENLQRLRKSLKGKAKEAVQALLTAPENVMKIIETLELRFGKPEFIVKMLIEKAKKAAPVKEDKVDTIIEFSTLIQNLSTTAQTLKCANHMANPQLLEDLLNKLPSSWKTEWCRHLARNQVEEETIKDLANWLSIEAKALSRLHTPKFGEDKITPKFEKTSHKSSRTVMTTVDENDKTCPYCGKKNHSLDKCYSFGKLDVDSRWKWLTEKKGICYGCLKHGHLSSKCTSKKCGEDGCQRQHHRLLHQIRKRKEETVEADPSKEVRGDPKPEPSEKKSITHSFYHKAGTVLLKIVPVILKGPKGTEKTFALLDDGSQVTMLETDMALKLGLSGPTSQLAIQGSGTMTETENDSQVVSLGISGVNDKNVYNLKNVRTRRNLCPELETIDIEKFPESFKLNDMDLDLIINAQPTILIGADNVHLVESTTKRRGNGVILAKTKLGWIVYGKLVQQPRNLRNGLSFCQFGKFGRQDEELNEIVKDNFKLESIGIKVTNENLYSRQDKKAIEIMERTTKFRDGSWETGLIWRDDEITMPASRNAAFKRLLSTERKMDKDPDFAILYNDKMKSYLDEGFARHLTREEIEAVGQRTWYLPHFGVVNPNKPGKIRIVFDAAAKAGGVSLNDKLLTGPDLLRSLPGNLIKFRQREIGFSGDIKDFFPRVKIRKQDQDSQRFLWRGNDKKRDPDTLVMQATIFGTVCAPYTSQAAKNKNAQLYEEEFPEAANAIINNHYMDDYLDSRHTTEDALKLISEVIEVHRRGGFEIGKFSCSSSEVLQQIPPKLRSTEEKEMTFGNEMNSERVLGLTWNPNTDTLSFNLKFHKVNSDVLNGSKRPTKRDILKMVMSIFDPLGLLSHYTIQGKILLQDIWRSEIGWDDELTTELYTKWRNWINQLDEIPELKIPRCYSMGMAERELVELHVFCDASESAYAAAAYLRIENKGNVDVQLAMAKSRVSSLKPISIPRLELQAALLGCRLSSFIKKEMDIEIDNCFYWSDSSTVILWLKSDAKRFKTFVANRVGEILETTSASEWNWISTKENVADEATRDREPADLSCASRWINGPWFLKLPKSHWPNTVENHEDKVDNDVLEIRKEFTGFSSLPSVRRFEFYMKLIRTTAWVLRFIESCKAKSRTKKILLPPELTVHEIEKAEKIWIKTSQMESFEDEMKCLRKFKPIKSSSKLFPLSPYLEEDGILRMKGRISAATGIDISTKFPIILDPKHDFTKLLVSHYHRRCGHHGHERIINDLRQRFWILKLRAAVKYAAVNCQQCKNRKVQPLVPEMGQLPYIRLMDRVRPFTYTGLDYFGPMEVAVGRRREKRYGALFTCMTTRAVHLEVAHSLDTNSAIMAIQRMICRRGKPKRIYSDNGTNFVGADNEIKKAVADLDQSKITRELASHGIEWCFNPPAAPHMGGSWERLVKSVKTALRATLKEKVPRDETLLTMMAAAEMTVNSRPLTYVSSDPDSPEALTPNHFLLLGSSENSAFGEVDENLKHPFKQWALAQRLADLFWRRWVREYLPTLTKRTKWFQPVERVKLGDVVVIADNDNIRDNWPIGRVIAVHPGRDGEVRVVTVKTSKNTYKRPVSKICVLDVYDREDKVAEVPISGGNMLSTTSNAKEEDKILSHFLKFEF